ncbi:hypothetical protein CYMTET_46823 [Cymbomonas tetramitiformis]|uniref:Uncharacterized protein n=1 Tax=Cymbomonas tetramitiformis TaxID=36881 RepID=A0AAE0BXB4_9CHLO|nr:hypothetical protein CYMTET_46823 [Cymbomonas tetramitiformis]
MAVMTKRAKREILRDSDVDASIRLVDTVRDSPTPEELRCCALRTEFLSVGLDDLSVFVLDDPSKTVFQPTNELLYDLLRNLVEANSAAEMFMLGTDAVTDRDGRL